MENLSKLLLLAKNTEQMTSLLTVLLTPSEVGELQQRIQILDQLRNGLSQREVAQNVGVGIATVTRGARELKYSPHSELIQKFLKDLSL